MRLDKVGASADYEAVTRSHLFPFADWIGDLRDRKILRADIIAGITVFTVLIPQSMANAQLADLPPHFGLYAAFLPPIVAALFGSSRHLSTGSVALISLMSAAAIQPLAAPGSELHISLTILLALMVGLIQLGLGLARLGALVNLLSHPVILGFTNAAAIIIGTSQIGVLFGVEVRTGGSHFARVWQMIEGAMVAPHWPTVGLAMLAFATMLIAKRLGPSTPWILVGVVLTTAVTAWGHLDTQHQILIVGAIPGGLPALYVPAPTPGVDSLAVPRGCDDRAGGFRWLDFNRQGDRHSDTAARGYQPGVAWAGPGQRHRQSVPEPYGFRILCPFSRELQGGIGHGVLFSRGRTFVAIDVAVVDAALLLPALGHPGGDHRDGRDRPASGRTDRACLAYRTARWRRGRGGVCDDACFRSPSGGRHPRGHQSVSDSLSISDDESANRCSIQNIRTDPCTMRKRTAWRPAITCV